MQEVAQVWIDNAPEVPGNVRVVLWTDSDPFPDLGPSVGIDTETELITDSILFPELVVLGCYDGTSRTCYIVERAHVQTFMRELCIRDIQQRYFNVGFDEGVLEGIDETMPLMDAANDGTVRDMQIRIHLHNIATQGFIPANRYSLAGCAKSYLNIDMDKGDGTENSDRLSFRVGKPITVEQYRYLALDCITTWLLGERVPEAPIDINTGQSIEVVHTQGMIVLAHIRANGFPVDMRVFNALSAKLQQDYKEVKDRILLYGYPDPDYDPAEELQDIKTRFNQQIARLCRIPETIYQPSKNTLRKILVLVENHAEEPDEVQMLRDDIQLALSDTGTLRAAPARLWTSMCSDYGFEAFDKATKGIVMLALTTKIIELLADQQDSPDFESFNAKAAYETASNYMDEHPAWLSNTPPIGAGKFLQRHIEGLVAANPNLHLEFTEKSHKYKLTRKDEWRLIEAGISDKFLKEYVALTHIKKYQEIYLNPKYIASDGRVHAKYDNIKATGRTSSSSPNLQNYPSHDPVYAPKNIFTAPHGAVLCATDYSFVELVNLAESCIQRFGFSSMGDIINAGVDPHRWFAGVRAGLISSDTDFAKSPDKVKEMQAFLKENITDEQRQHSKAAKPKLALYGVIHIEEESELLESATTATISSEAHVRQTA